MNTSTQQKIYYALGAVIIILAIIWITLASSKQSSAPAEEMTTVSTSTESTSSTATESMITVTGVSTSSAQSALPTFAYALQLASSTYSQNDAIPMTLAVLNMTDKTQTLTFADGCQGTYNIGTFNELAHIQCQPNPTSFVIKPHGIVTIPMTHYPSVYKIPPGMYTLTANVVGYGGTSQTITITN